MHYHALTMCISHEKRSPTVQRLIGGLDSSLSPFQHIISDKDETAYFWLFHIFQIEKALKSTLPDCISQHSAFVPLADEGSAPVPRGPSSARSFQTGC